MWFHVKGAPAVATIGRDALWTELGELAAVAGAQIHVHLDHDPANDPDAAAHHGHAEYAMKHGGGSGCVIRHGYLVKEWGSVTARADIKSPTKGTMGAAALGLAVDAKLVKLADIAQTHYPALETEKLENVKRGWLGEITVRQLATMTAGFDDRRPPQLVCRPGTSGLYSNDTSNMLAELLTIQFNEDLSMLMKRRVLDPIGLASSD